MRATVPIRPPAPSSPYPPRVAPPRVARRPRTTARRATAWGLAVSLLLHLLLLILASRTHIEIVPRFSRPAPPVVRSDRAPREMQAYRIVPVTEATPEPSTTVAPQEEPREEPLRPQVEPGPAPAGTEPAIPEAGPTEEALTPAERLRPRMGDPRLWERPGAPPPEVQSDIDRVRARVYSRLQELNDSLAAEGEAAARATDWTITGKDGKKWGISPGKIHLGDLTLPLPVGFGGPPDKAAEARERARKDAEIEGQAERARSREILEERTKAIRERKDRERTEKRAGPTSGTGSGSTSGSSSGSPAGAQSGSGSGTDAGSDTTSDTDAVSDTPGDGVSGADP